MQNGITRRNFNKTCAAGILALTAGGRLAAAQPTKQPNVLLITTDQQRVDAMSAVGNQWAKTPHMDSIAANGVYFRKSYCLLDKKLSPAYMHLFILLLAKYLGQEGV